MVHYILINIPSPLPPFPERMLRDPQGRRKITSITRSGMLR